MVLATLIFAGPAAVAQVEETENSRPENREAQGGDLVQCLLPAEIDRLGTQLTKAAPRRIIETTAEDCAERKGEVVDEPR